MKVLVCIDGEPHTTRAIEHAISLGLSRPAEVTALHVVDPWLKQFYNEIYAQGRKQYLEYVDACLQENAERVRKDFGEMSLAKGLKAGFTVRYGTGPRKYLAEVVRLCPDLSSPGTSLLPLGQVPVPEPAATPGAKGRRETSLISIKGSREINRGYEAQNSGLGRSINSTRETVEFTSRLRKPF